MKIIKRTLLFITIFTISHINTVKLNNKKSFPWETPKAKDLTDHFGTEPTRNLYGPHQLIYDTLPREGITGESTPVSPIKNFNKEINAVNVVSGDLLNTAYDASKIITAPLAGNIYLFRSQI